MGVTPLTCAYVCVGVGGRGCTPLVPPVAAALDREERARSHPPAPPGVPGVGKVELTWVVSNPQPDFPTTSGDQSAMRYVGQNQGTLHPGPPAALTVSGQEVEGRRCVHALSAGMLTDMPLVRPILTHPF
jgi:hypothetical protein